MMDKNVVPKNGNRFFEKSEKKCEKGIDKREKVWYNLSVKTKQSAPLSPRHRE